MGIIVDGNLDQADLNGTVGMAPPGDANEVRFPTYGISNASRIAYNGVRRISEFALRYVVIWVPRAITYSKKDPQLREFLDVDVAGRWRHGLTQFNRGSLAALDKGEQGWSRAATDVMLTLTETRGLQGLNYAGGVSRRATQSRGASTRRLYKTFGGTPRSTIRSGIKGRVLLTSGSFRLRQDQHAPLGRRIRTPDERTDPDRRQGHGGHAATPPPNQHGLSELRVVPSSERGGQRRLRAQVPQPFETGDQRPSWTSPGVGPVGRL